MTRASKVRWRVIGGVAVRLTLSFIGGLLTTTGRLLLICGLVAQALAGRRPNHGRAIP